MFQIKFVEKIKVHILFSITFFRNRAIYELMSKNLLESERPLMTIRRRVACWISKATHAWAHSLPCSHTHTHTHTEICNIYCFLTATMIRERVSVLRCTFIVCLVSSFGQIFESSVVFWSLNCTWGYHDRLQRQWIFTSLGTLYPTVQVSYLVTCGVRKTKKIGDAGYES